jgi:hypothetical protein
MGVSFPKSIYSGSFTGKLNMQYQTGADESLSGGMEWLN